MSAPTEIRLRKAEKLLEIAFADGARFALPAEYLRVESPSAEVQGHGPGQKVIVAGRRHVGIIGLEPVGHYALRISFDDLHGDFYLGISAQAGRGTGNPLGGISGGAGIAGLEPRTGAARGWGLILIMVALPKSV
jgi:DUF971 family protein